MSLGTHFFSPLTLASADALPPALARVAERTRRQEEVGLRAGPGLVRRSRACARSARVLPRQSALTLTRRRRAVRGVPASAAASNQIRRPMSLRRSFAPTARLASCSPCALRLVDLCPRRRRLRLACCRARQYLRLARTSNRVCRAAPPGCGALLKPRGPRRQYMDGAASRPHARQVVASEMCERLGGCLSGTRMPRTCIRHQLPSCTLVPCICGHPREMAPRANHLELTFLSAAQRRPRRNPTKTNCAACPFSAGGAKLWMWKQVAGSNAPRYSAHRRHSPNRRGATSQMLGIRVRELIRARPRLKLHEYDVRNSIRLPTSIFAHDSPLAWHQVEVDHALA